jgi:4'-phosphopantetheinyl transferase
MVVNDEVRVWSIRLDLVTEDVTRLEALLSAGERRRAQGFALPQLRRRYAAAHGALRVILAEQLRCSPKTLSFRRGTYGKPALDGAEANTLEFNLSHSDERALVATAWHRRVGVDLERRRSIPDAQVVARDFFSPTEFAALRAAPPAARDDAFLRCWTRKEAYLKARGDGLTLPLHEFDVTLDEPARLIGCRFDPAEPARWSLCALDAGADYVATMAVEGQGWTLRRCAWPVD